MQKIPLSNSPNHTFSATLSVNGRNVAFEFFLSYNEVGEYWTLRVKNPSTGVVILDSIPLLTDEYPDANFLSQYDYLKIGNAYIVRAAPADTDFPDNTNLGTLFLLVWGDNAEYYEADSIAEAVAIIESLEDEGRPYGIVTVQGPQGLAGVSIKGEEGDQGNQGDQGYQGNPGEWSGGYWHAQTVASATWTVTHNLGSRYAVVEVINSGNQSIIPQNIIFIDEDSLEITFSSAVSGNAVISIGGKVGDQGDQGDAGTSDIPGPQGYQGHQGYQGYQGNQGNQGYQSSVEGPQGNQGNQGNQGYQSSVAGPQGPQGDQGSGGAGERINKTQADSPYTVVAADLTGLVVFTNTGATDQTIFQLPAGADGYKFRGVVTAAQYMQFKASGTETIRFLGVQTAGPGYIRSNAIGNVIEAEWSGTEWVTTGIGGAWSYDA